jgi:hypothetical protein
MNMPDASFHTPESSRMQVGQTGPARRKAPHVRRVSWTLLVTTAVSVLVCMFVGLGSSPVSAGEFCFGAAGQQCGQFRNGRLQGVAFCSPPVSDIAVCAVHGGSLTHDPCCVANPNGVACGRQPENGRCRVEWDRAVHRWFWGYQWYRTVNTAIENDTGVVVRPQYCARSGAGVHREDRSHCCSGRSREAGFLLRVGRPDLFICN